MKNFISRYVISISNWIFCIKVFIIFFKKLIKRLCEFTKFYPWVTKPKILNCLWKLILFLICEWFSLLQIINDLFRLLMIRDYDGLRRIDCCRLYMILRLVWQLRVLLNAFILINLIFCAWFMTTLGLDWLRMRSLFLIKCIKS